MTETTHAVATSATSHGADPRRSERTVLVVDTDGGLRDLVGLALQDIAGNTPTANGITAAEAVRARQSVDAIVASTRLPEGLAVDWVRELRSRGFGGPVVLVAAEPEDISLNEPAALANTHFLTRPVAPESLRTCLAEALPEAAPTSTADSEGVVEPIVAESDAMRELLALLRRVASRTTTVLLEGESGTGKEIAAQYLHAHSGRPGLFVPVNCGAIAPELLESELFGHIKGAFTGATQSREGLFTHAHGGTLFLDEICEMPLGMQAKLLRVLEDRTIRPLGAERELAVDVRIITASNRNMADEVAAGRFREDLFYRLNVLGVRLPPLRERPADIAGLTQLFADQLARELALPAPQLTSRDLAELARHTWPGNVRELRNLMERAMLLNRSPADCLDSTAADTTPAEATAPDYASDLTLAEVERRHILKVVQLAGGNKSEAARRLGVSRKTLERKFRTWGETPP